MLCGQSLAQRGESRRMLGLADLSLREYPPEEGPTPCHVLVTQMGKGKTIRNGKKRFMGAMRHRNPLRCLHGATAGYLFWRWHISGEPAPSFRTRRDWYRIKLLVGENRLKELSYKAQYGETWGVFCGAGITSTKKTHAPRGESARAAELHGVPDDQVSPFLLF